MMLKDQYLRADRRIDCENSKDVVLMKTLFPSTWSVARAIRACKLHHLFEFGLQFWTEIAQYSCARPMSVVGDRRTTNEAKRFATGVETASLRDPADRKQAYLSLDHRWLKATCAARILSSTCWEVSMLCNGVD
jgi:hypothetical protein